MTIRNEIRDNRLFNGDRLATHTYTNGTDDIVETYAYDMLGNRIVSTDALGNTVFRAYDPFGQITAEWGATYPVRYTYDTQGRRTSLSTTRDGTTWDTTAWAYDPVTGNCISKTYADGSTVSYTYTPDNLPLRTTYASRKWKEKVYDAQRRLCGVVYSSSDMDYELQLDVYGNATNVQDAAENTWRHVFGLNSILLGEEYVSMGEVQFSASAVTNSLSRIVDPLDRPAGFAFSVNGTAKCGIGYDYDCDGHVAHFVATNSAGRSFSVVYTNVAGYCCGYTLTTPSGGTLRRTVDRDDCRRSLVTNCLTYFNSSLVDSNLYAFDALSRPTTRTSGATGVSPVDSTFAYNDRSEVVSATIGTNSFAHAYDDIGNHLLFADNAVTNTYTHNSLNQIATSCRANASPRTIHHNADGGMSSDGTWSYAYDAEDQLRSVTSRSLTNGAIRVRNSYDYRHRRTTKTVQRLNVATALPPAPPVELREWETLEMRTFVYDDWNLIHETVYTVDSGVTNVTEIQYFWGIDLSGTIQGAGGVGGLLAVSRNGQLYFPTFDNNGNVTKYIDESGNVVAAYEYDDFGRTISQSGPLADFFRHRFSTKYYDPETGLYYYSYRYYKPQIMRWLTEDPLEESGGMNLYAFNSNSPVHMFDALGLKPQAQCKKNGVLIELLFNGLTLSGSGFSTTAASGRPTAVNRTSWVSSQKILGSPAFGGVRSEYTFDYSAERQQIKDEGPTPEGAYWIEVNERRSARTSKYSHILLRKGWGDFSWSLHPDGSTQTYGRGGFFIHGGFNWGSAGCIDIKEGDAKLNEFLSGLCDCYVPVKVNYVVKQNKLSEREITWHYTIAPYGVPYIR